MKRILVLALILFTLPLSLRADEASKHAKIEELFSILHLDNLTKQIMAAASAQTKALTARYGGAAVDPASQAKIDAFQSKILALVDAQLGWKVMEPEYVKLYSENFTEPQIDDLLAFYKSPTGQVFVEKTPELTKASMQLAQEKMIALQPQLKELVDDFIKEMAASQPAAPAPKN